MVVPGNIIPLITSLQATLMGNNTTANSTGVPNNTSFSTAASNNIALNNMDKPSQMVHNVIGNDNMQSTTSHDNNRAAATSANWGEHQPQGGEQFSVQQVNGFFPVNAS
jgi:hypothetical protein